MSAEQTSEKIREHIGAGGDEKNKSQSHRMYVQQISRRVHRFVDKKHCGHYESGINQQKRKICEMHHRFVKLRKHRNSTADYKNSENEYGDSAYAEQKIRHTEAQRKNPHQSIELFRYSVSESVPYFQHAQSNDNTQEYRDHNAVYIISCQNYRNVNQPDDQSDQAAPNHRLFCLCP